MVFNLQRGNRSSGRLLEIHPIDERIRELCEKVKVAEGPEVESLLTELRAALQEHAQFVRYMALRASRSSPTEDAD